ncbi:MAG: aminopeptidase N C-terminal domain-containing protein, partial [Pseudomonadota bacterium]|nr:aminopeptidase N C-terminal domain-containing protein [Pseudomonadota bacterium]
IEDKEADRALIALTMTLPGLTYIGEQYKVVNVDAIYHVHHWLRVQLAEANQAGLLEIYQSLNNLTGEYRYHKDDIAQRMLKNACLKYLALSEQNFALVKTQFDAQQNMTDVLAALDSITHTDHAERETCLQAFYDKWQTDPLVLDKWFTLQAGSHHIHALEHVKALVNHADFSYENPNRVRSVLGVFGRMNLLGFHRANGEGYEFLADSVMKVDKLNPQVAARIVAPFTHWQRYDQQRQVYMKSALQRILELDGLSKDVYEIVSKTLAVK